MSVSALILAAGESRRFNGIKLLAKINGKTLLEIVVEKIHRSSVENCYICLGAHFDQLRDQLKDQLKDLIPEHCEVVVSKNWQSGIGHSIADSIKAITNKEERVLIVLADQILLSVEHINQLIEISNNNTDKIVATSAKEILMPPAIFPKQYFSELEKLEGDKGAAKLLKNESKRVISIVYENAAYDIDTQEDLETVKSDFPIQTLEEI